jgi:hypothetical protein
MTPFVWSTAVGSSRSGTPITTSAAFRRCTGTVIKHVTLRIGKHWPKTKLVWRAKSHYGRGEAMEWAENNGADYIFGLAGNNVLRLASSTEWACEKS